MQSPTRDRFDFGAGIKQRKIPALRPHFKEIIVMGFSGIATLAGAVGGERRIPICRVDDDPKRAAGGLVVAAAGVIDRIAIPAARQRSHIQLRLPFGFHGGT